MAVLATALLPAIGSAAPADDTTPAQASQHRPDNRPGPLTKAQQDLRKAALEKLVKGQAKLESIDEVGGQGGHRAVSQLRHDRVAELRAVHL